MIINIQACDIGRNTIGMSAKIAGRMNCASE